MKTLSELKEKWLKDPAVLSEYKKADEEYSLLEAMIEARLSANLTQTDIAKRVGTTQSAIARLEGGGVSPSIETLRKYAEATGKRLKIHLVD